MYVQNTWPEKTDTLKVTVTMQPYLHVLPKFDVIASYDYFNKNKTISDKQTNYVQVYSIGSIPNAVCKPSIHTVTAIKEKTQTCFKHSCKFVSELGKWKFMNFLASFL